MAMLALVVSRSRSRGRVADVMRAGDAGPRALAIVLGRRRAIMRSRGRPASRRTMRTSIAGRKLRSYWRKRGQKSVITMTAPWLSVSVVSTIAVLRS